MPRFYRPSESEIMAEARQALRRRVAAAGGTPPAGCTMPRYRAPANAAARGSGRITAETEAGDRAAGEERRKRSLQTCHRYALQERPRKRAPAERGTYVPELAARVEDDRNLTDGARRCARKLAEVIYRQNREGRFTEITVTYLMNALRRSRRTVQRYLRLLEAEGYIDTQVVRGARSRLCTGLLIALRTPILARHHRERWPQKARNPGASRESQNDRVSYYRRGRDRLTVRQWSLLCMDGVFRAFMKTDPLGLMERSPPGRA